MPMVIKFHLVILCNKKECQTQKIKNSSTQTAIRELFIYLVTRVLVIQVVRWMEPAQCRV